MTHGLHHASLSRRESEASPFSQDNHEIQRRNESEQRRQEEAERKPLDTIVTTPCSKPSRTPDSKRTDASPLTTPTHLGVSQQVKNLCLVEPD